MLVLGLVLVAIALVLLLAEAHLSTGGLMAVGAVVALVCGVALLAAGAAAGLLAVLAVSTGCCVLSFGGLVLLGRRLPPIRRQRPRSGPQAMVGHAGTMRVTDTTSRVMVDGALWRAKASPLDDPDGLHDGDRVVVEHVNGLTVSVRRAEELELN